MAEKMYFEHIHPQDKKTLEQMTQNSHWDSAQLRDVMVALSKVPKGNFIPAQNAPQSIHIQSWRPFIDDLTERTQKIGREHSRSIIADTESQKIVMSGKIVVGTDHSTHLDLSKQPGRERKQRHVGSIHTHPNEALGGVSSNGEFSSHGLSGQDYITFLSDNEQQLMIVSYGPKSSIFVLKTTSTPNNISPDSLVRRVQQCTTDYLHGNRHVPFIQRVADFNKSVCLEFGLAFYLATEKTRDLFERINVTQ